MIFFVGDEPGLKNIDPEVAFVGTASYKKLLGWIADMKLSTNDIFIVNKKDIKEYKNMKMFYMETKTLHDGFHSMDIEPTDRVIALGRKAEKHLKNMGLKCFYLPHPSGANPTANKGKVLDTYLLKCMEYIKQ